MKRSTTLLACCLLCGLPALAPEARAFGPGMMGHGTPAAAEPAGPIKVEKAKGKEAYTVAEVFANGKELDGKTAVIRGKVVKVSRAIMGKNWIHLKDGSGDDAKGTGRLVVTSQDLPAVGDVVTARGTLHKDKDFGAGYRYDMIMEDASVKP